METISPNKKLHGQYLEGNNGTDTRAQTRNVKKKSKTVLTDFILAPYLRAIGGFHVVFME
jgi:hypothetical protein